jgi:ABC-type nickel/cobalt efflux system permease component RcnA
MDLHLLYEPVEIADQWLSGLFAGAPLLVALGIALLLGLRHASDPDHLVAVTSLVAAGDTDARAAARLGAWWGLGHASMLLAIGMPLIVFKSELPGWLSSSAEKAIAVVILLLAARVLWKWARGDYSAGRHLHDDGGHHHLRRGEHHHDRAAKRTPVQAFGIGLLHGLAGSGAVTVLLISGVPGTVESLAALAVFAPMSLISMATFTAAFAWVLTRPVVEPVYRGALIPLLGGFGVVFALWYGGIT